LDVNASGALIIAQEDDTMQNILCEIVSINNSINKLNNSIDSFKTGLICRCSIKGN
jgi:hypothetical protein